MGQRSRGWVRGHVGGSVVTWVGQRSRGWVRGHVDGSEFAKGVISSTPSQGVNHLNGPAPFCKSVTLPV